MVIMIGLIGGLLYYFLIYSAKSPMARESEMLGGRLAGKTPTEMQSILDETVEKGQVLIGISAAPVFEENGKKGRLGIENDAKNQYSFQVTLTEDETGTELYKSGLIDPGYYVEFVELSKRLAAGDYAATAVFTTYSPEETDDAIAQVTAKITLHACSPIKVTSDEQWDWSKIQNFADEAGELHTITLQAHEEPGLKEGSTSALHSVPNFIVQVSNGATLQMGKDVRMPCWIVKHYGQQVAIPTPFRLRLCLRFLNRKQINQREALNQA